MNSEKDKRVQYRAYEFGLSIIDLLETLPKNYIYQTLGQQLLRAATSIGANIVEAQAGTSRKDFANFYHIALKSANETKYWLALLREKLQGEKSSLDQLLKEVTEISNILGASLLTLKGKKSF